jgi:precorrin-3B synthase
VVTTPVRDRPDACPGALRTHRAADGLLVRLRLPGGRLPSGSARGLADVAQRHADGAVHLTSRGNVQLRGMRDVDGGTDPALVDDVRACGLLPSLSHELVRNVVASPWSGRRAGLVDVGPVVAAVDAALCADPALAALPGRFLVALDDGSGNIAGSGADVTWWAQDAGSGALLVAGVDTGRRVPVADVPTAVLEVAHAFLSARAEADGAAWHVAELPCGAVGFAARLMRLGYAGQPASSSDVGRLRPPPAASGLSALGAVRQDDGSWAVAGLVPLARLDARSLRLLADAADLGAGELVVTPWREVVVPGLAAQDVRQAERLVAAAGLVTDPASPWRRVTACVGRPSCARALADVRSLARDTVAALDRPAGAATAPLHLAGCERRCGRPASAHLEVVATVDGCAVAEVGPASPDGERASSPVAAVAAADVPVAIGATVSELQDRRSSEDL